jgi:UDP-galactose transporter B1
MEKAGEKVQVLTAGGAANLGGGNSKKKRRNQKKKKSDAVPEVSSYTAADTVTTPATSEVAAVATKEHQNHSEPTKGAFSLEIEHSEREHEDENLDPMVSAPDLNNDSISKHEEKDALLAAEPADPLKIEDLYQQTTDSSKNSDLLWLFLCFIGIMCSFVCYGLLLEYTTSGGRKLHELSFLFVTSGLYTLTAAAGRYVRAETPSTIPPARFAVLGLTSMGSTFCSVRSLR